MSIQYMNRIAVGTFMLLDTANIFRCTYLLLIYIYIVDHFSVASDTSDGCVCLDGLEKLILSDSVI